MITMSDESSRIAAVDVQPQVKDDTRLQFGPGGLTGLVGGAHLNLAIAAQTQLNLLESRKWVSTKTMVIKCDKHV